ncbi:MAG: aldo/keto reductase [SAR202 cluster bacterium]|nr:aldo/keto reductase [SAR202 cluster bacterium]
MQTRPFGRTGLNITPIGLGLAEINRHEDAKADFAAAGRVLGAALDSGVNFLDTAAMYGNTEEMIGASVSHRRADFILATKCGQVYGDAVGQPWSAPVIEHSIDRSLRRMKTECVDMVQLHSCSLAVLQRGEAIEAMQKAKKAGKTRFIGYSGDNEPARWAVESGLFDTLQTSYNLVDQRARTTGLLKLARAKGMGIIIKRPVANSVWGKSESPYPYANEYLRRAKILRDLGPIPGAPEDAILLAMGFVMAHPEVDTIIVGSHNPAHIRSNIEMVEKRLPIPTEAVRELQRRFEQHGADWVQLQ